MTVTGDGLIHCKKVEKALTFCRGNAAVQYNYRKEKSKEGKRKKKKGKSGIMNVMQKMEVVGSIGKATN
ncbi:MAG: hypothetical protein J6E41_02400 [Lachnospiraceae bacterium]|nr:hypothetical protein [Lachnospiraceae bacterium]